MRVYALMWCVVGLWWCGGCEQADHDRLVFEEMQELASSSPTPPLVVSFGEGQGGVSAQAMRALWSSHPEWTREQALEAAIRQELVWQRWGGEPLSHEATQALHFAKKRGAVSAWIDQELLTTDEAQIDEQALTSLVNQQVIARARPAGYRASHLVVRLPEGAGEAKVGAARQAVITLASRVDRAQSVSGGELLRVLAALDEERFEGFDVAVNVGMMFPLQPVPEEVMPEGWVNVVPEFSDGAKQVVAARGFGQLSDPIKSSFGWHVIVVHERFEMAEPSRDEVEAILRYSWRNSLLQEAMLSRLEPLYAQYTWSSNPGALEDELTSGDSTREQ